MLAASCSSLLVLTLAAPADVQFNRDIRPILSDHCYQCHGPDKARRKADLRLDTEAGLRAVVKAGDLKESSLYQKITEADEQTRMPPKKGRPLNARQIDLLKGWIEQGGKWEKHWAFLPPRKSSPPQIRNPKSETRNAIDAFIVARLEKEDFSQSRQAAKTTLLRRVTLDLTGLPATLEEVEAALGDPSPDWYERAVDRLLASPRFGERLAADWLDAARYADSNGYQSDGERHMWRWRDWVLEALNANMPFDQFTIEQLAGDMLPNATLDQKIATGFNRNHRGNAEGGIVPEEYAVEYVVDRVDTTMAVWQGLTVGCARCHDHKFDPISAKEYYQLFAYFNNVPEKGRAIKFGNSPPMMDAPTREQREQLHKFETHLASAEKLLASFQHDVTSAMERWEKTNPKVPNWNITESMAKRFDLDDEIGLETREGRPNFVDGRLVRAAELDGKRYFEAKEVGGFGFYDKFSLTAWVLPRGKNGVIVSRVNESLLGDGYMVRLENGKVQFSLTKRWLDDAARVETELPIGVGQWRHLAVTYDGSRAAAGMKIYVDGKLARVKVLLDELNQTFDNTSPFRIGAGGGGEGRFEGLIDEVRLYSRRLETAECEILSVAENLTDILSVPSEKRSAAQTTKLRTYFTRHHAPNFVRLHDYTVRISRQANEELRENVPTVMVMEELPKPRDTFVLLRGQYDKRGEKVTAALPQALLGKQHPASNRLEFARWLVSADNPLTARVTVNRFWQHYFGVGLVKTPEDFGSQGEAPSHPELLDWLAVEFRESGWDVKALHRLIVTSATYRQSSRVTPEHLQRDPANRLLARGPRLRLPAETIRDQALAAAGLLVERVGGPSVKTYQPAGLWEELAGVEYKADQGEALYRRSLYTFWKRTVTPPAMATFDATAREACTVNRARTNTPLQALALLNDVPFVEAARVLAERIARETPKADEQITRAFVRLVGRRPTDAEFKILRPGFDRHLAHYRKHPEAAAKLLKIGAAPADAKLDAPTVATLTSTVGLILNLDEVITRE